LPQTVMKPGAVGCVAVTLTMTADAPVAGTPPWPATARVTVPVEATGVVVATPVALRVSSSRIGVRGCRVRVPGLVGVPAR